MVSGNRDGLLLDMLINALEAERFLRRAVLVELLAELRHADRPTATAIAQRLLTDMDGGALEESAFTAAMGQLRGALGSTCGIPESGVAVREPLESGPSIETEVARTG